jgi:hypothetical protein
VRKDIDTQVCAEASTEKSKQTKRILFLFHMHECVSLFMYACRGFCALGVARPDFVPSLLATKSRMCTEGGRIMRFGVMGCTRGNGKVWSLPIPFFTSLKPWRNRRAKKGGGSSRRLLRDHAKKQPNAVACLCSSQEHRNRCSLLSMPRKAMSLPPQSNIEVRIVETMSRNANGNCCNARR